MYMRCTGKLLLSPRFQKISRYLSASSIQNYKAGGKQTFGSPFASSHGRLCSEHPQFINPRLLLSSTSHDNGTYTGQGEHDSFDSGTATATADAAEMRTRVLEAALRYVTLHGWTREAVEAACRIEGLPEGLHTMAMPNGGIDLVLYFYGTRNEQLSREMAQWRASDEASGTVGGGPEYAAKPRLGSAAEVDAFLVRALETRLRMLEPVLDVWPQALGLLALPQNVPSSVGLVAQLVDEIWAQTGDRSTDMTWYAKRLGLAYVYNLTELYMLQDQSADHADTWQFLHARIAELRSLKQMNLKAVASLLCNGAYAVGNVTFNLFGWRRPR